MCGFQVGHRRVTKQAPERFGVCQPPYPHFSAFGANGDPVARAHTELFPNPLRNNDLTLGADLHCLSHTASVTGPPGKKERFPRRMRIACYDPAMSKMVQIRDVPDEVHSKLVARASREGKSLSEMLREEVAMVANRPSRADVLRRIREREPVELPEDPADTVRRLRDFD